MFVCARVKDYNLSNYSSCTVAAKGLFADTCSYMQLHPQQHWKHTKLKNMYCVAATNFKPTIAQISTPTKEESKLWEIKQKCSLLTLKANKDGLKSTENERQKACDVYSQTK